MKLSNTWKHILMALIIAFISGLVFIRLPNLALFWAVAVGMIFLGWEQAQYQRAKKQGWSWRTYNWADAIVDFFAGYGTFSLVFWLIQWAGGYFR